MRRRAFLGLMAWPLFAFGKNLEFPRDHGAHPEFRTEWWYVTGWLEDETAHAFGFQVTFFRSRPGVAEASESRFAPKQLLFAHAALADPKIKQRLLDLGGVPAGGTPEAFAKFIAHETESWAKVVKFAGIKAE